MSRRRNRRWYFTWKLDHPLFWRGGGGIIIASFPISPTNKSPNELHFLFRLNEFLFALPVFAVIRLTSWVEGAGAVLFALSSSYSFSLPPPPPPPFSLLRTLYLLFFTLVRIPSSLSPTPYSFRPLPSSVAVVLLPLSHPTSLLLFSLLPSPPSFPSLFLRWIEVYLLRTILINGPTVITRIAIVIVVVFLLLLSVLPNSNESY